MATTTSLSALPTTLLSTTLSLAASNTTSSLYPTATTTLFYNSTCNTTLSYNTTTSLNTTSLICLVPSSGGGNSFPTWIFELWPLDVALLIVGAGVLYGLVFFFAGIVILALKFLKLLGRGAKGVGNGVGRGVGSVKKGVNRKVGQTREWNEGRVKRVQERREKRLVEMRGTIALEAIPLP
ncbi:uncharacterized protein LY89DRAFT_119050 [Mollisia scopiformis]|uniref:Uncharacterized protein n=1 Tax=Mollisia scopiformis TaxID=149040 RepID=A0A194X394_MOLSC|nr:uncharacterized protein LY89DRAFT_119050 [Mollisia scopiformis]KUJ14670.1 hypothetical protein LY89DRAFT_119050 [Mollisia scopiformis]